MNPRAKFRPELKLKVQKWILSFYHLDPRYQILTFFNLVCTEGADSIATEKDEDYYSYNLDRNVSQYHLHREAAAVVAAKTTTATTACSSSANNNNNTKNNTIDTGAAENTYFTTFNNPLLYRKSAANLSASTAQLLANMFDRSSILTVWRPCSREAMRKMMEGTGVGKGLDIKGKSAKQGKLSAYVPFLQIHDNSHKKQIQALPKSADMRIYYKSKAQREFVYQTLQSFLEQYEEQQRLVGDADTNHQTFETENKETTDCENDSPSSMEMSTVGSVSNMSSTVTSLNEPAVQPQDATSTKSSKERRKLLRKIPSRMKKIEKYQKQSWYGLQVSQRLFWHATVANANISRDGTGTETGRPSTPGFQDANMITLRVACSTVTQPHPMPVVVQSLCCDFTEELNLDNHDIKTAATMEQALNPLYLVMAYEENGTVTPVVSDFDGFLMGWRREALWFGCNLPREQEDLMMWCVEQVESILERQKESPAADTWTFRWLEILKREAHNGFRPEIPEYGFGDPKSYGIMEQAAKRLSNTGAVRHGSECFNYYFPQEIDDNFLLISDTLKPVPWRYVNVQELQSILSEKIAEGFVFPLNPKWVLCDPGWKKLYDELMASDALYADLSKDVWYPPYSGIRERIDDIHKRHPHGFLPNENPPNGIAVCQTVASQTVYSPLRQNLDAGEKLTGDVAVDLAELELEDYRRRSVRRKLVGQLMESRLMDMYEIVEEEKELQQDNDSLCNRARGSESSSESRPFFSRLLRPTLIRNLRQITKRDEPRNQRDAVSVGNVKEDEEYITARAALNSSSTTGDGNVVASSTGSLRLAD
ncbi:hypothetical protein IV203_030549 [Nitzschia inconspicua]|uniref:Uncharacterized protein n=1 Tax=Nitzschia inconspicua TaxID=303405 RepID=A0A9K3PDC6_9STRA|nr:hypothetical protein IV203_022885 [Nitzschia inconspicua]KAG7367806.1 hypothetical protein IV203_030549 [Nitzschia inconspicua]